MELLSERILKNMPPVPPDKLRAYSDETFAVFKPHCLFPGPAGFNCYEFVIGLETIPGFIVDKKKYTSEANTVISINPNQPHGSTGYRENVNYIPLFIAKDFIDDIAKSMYNKSKIVVQNDVLRISPHIVENINLFMSEIEEKQTGFELILQSLKTSIAVNLIRQVKSSIPTMENTRIYDDKKNMDRVIEFLHECDNFQYSSKDMAQLVNYSPYHFIRLFKSQTGKTPYEYLLDIKMNKACILLGSCDKTITEICQSCGFSSINHFTTVFRKKIGLSPTGYRKLINKK